MRVWICPLPEGRELMQSITRVGKCLENLFPLLWATRSSRYRFKGNFYALSFKSNLLSDLSSEHSRRSFGGEQTLQRSLDQSQFLEVLTDLRMQVG